MHFVSIITTDPETNIKYLRNGLPVDTDTDAISDPLHITWSNPTIILSLPSGAAFVPALFALLSDALAHNIRLLSRDFYYPLPGSLSIHFNNYDPAILTETFVGASSYAVVVRSSIRSVVIENAPRWPHVCSILQRACNTPDYLPRLDTVTIHYSDQISNTPVDALPHAVSHLHVYGRLPEHATTMIHNSPDLRSLRLNTVKSRFPISHPFVDTLILSNTDLTAIPNSLPSIRRIIVSVVDNGVFPSIPVPVPYPSLETIDCTNPSAASLSQVLSFITPFIRSHAFARLPKNISKYFTGTSAYDAYIREITASGSRYSAQIPYMTQPPSTWPPSLLIDAPASDSRSA